MTTTTTMSDERIWRRSTCNCGCRGRDHRRTFYGTVRDIEDAPVAAPRVHPSGFAEVVVARGVVRANGTRYLVERRALRCNDADAWLPDATWTIVGLAD
jgi:hypothetical protein